MMKKIQVIIFAVVFFGISVLTWVTPDKEYSESERRLLAKLPGISMETIIDGTFQDGAEKYVTDQFPFRDRLRSAKALSNTRFSARKTTTIYMKLTVMCQRFFGRTMLVQ